MDVSICIPVHNEKLALRPTVLELIEAFDQLPYKYEIIIIDDGSTDNCTDNIKDLKVRIIRHRRNLGGGIARVSGMRYAKAPIIFQTDADGTYPCDQIPEMMEQMKNAEMVIGARKRESARDFHLLRSISKWILRVLGGILSGHKIPDLNSGMRVYNRRLGLRYAYLYPKGHSIMSTMTLAFLTEGLRVEFVPIDYRERIGKSSFRPIQDTYNYILTIVRTIVYFDPLRILMPVSMFIACIAVFFTLRDLFLFLQINSVTIIAWISTLLVFMIAVLSDQFSRLSRQVAYLSHEDMKDDDLIEEITK